MNPKRWLTLALLLAASGCIPAGGGGGGGGDDDGGEADGFVDPDDGIPPADMFVDPDDGIPPADMFVDPDDGIPPADMFVDPDDGIPPADMAVEPGAEQCNMLDDDGDGAIDEGFGGLGEPCFVGVGLCEAEGTVICTPDGRGTVCDAQSPGAAPEQCNGLDDDCDGAVDEALVPLDCDSGGPGRCAEGLEQCLGGEPLCIPRLDPIDEACNGEDDDCDGAIDEGDVCDACAGVECPAGQRCVEGACVAVDPCAGVMCPPGNLCDGGRCVAPEDAIPIAPVGASFEVGGTLDAGAPFWNRPNEDCAAPAAVVHHYRTVRLINQTGAPRSLIILGTWGLADGYLHVYRDPFQPNGLDGCIAGNDDFNGTGSSQLSDIPIGVGEVLVVVVSTFEPEATIDDYVLRVQTANADGGLERNCADGRDDDGNGLIDCADPACADDAACRVDLPACDDPLIVDDATRNVGVGDGAACDREGDANAVPFDEWFRFAPPAGVQMPEEAPPTNHCGTDAPGWLRDGHPGPDEGVVERSVCFHWNGDPCRWEHVIEVVDCGAFYAYRASSQGICSLRYCAE